MPKSSRKRTDHRRFSWVRNSNKDLSACNEMFLPGYSTECSRLLSSHSSMANLNNCNSSSTSLAFQKQTKMKRFQVSMKVCLYNCFVSKFRIASEKDTYPHVPIIILSSKLIANTIGFENCLILNNAHFHPLNKNNIIYDAIPFHIGANIAMLGMNRFKLRKSNIRKVLYWPSFLIGIEWI